MEAGEEKSRDLIVTTAPYSKNIPQAFNTTYLLITFNVMNGDGDEYTVELKNRYTQPPQIGDIISEDMITLYQSRTNDRFDSW